MNLKFLNISSYVRNVIQIFYQREFRGWGRKKTGRFALLLYKKFGGSVTLLEDGFIRSLGLGVEKSPSFSIVEDDVGIYYDATMPSRLENILNSYDFKIDTHLMKQAKDAMDLIKKHHISKYNHAPLVNDRFIKKYNLDEKTHNVLIVSQTKGDESLIYGMSKEISTHDMICTAIKENPNSNIYIKIHPDVLSGKKYSDIDIEKIPQDIYIIADTINPISLLEHFSKVYTKTSGMGFEALMMGCECVCLGLPYYAGWGVTQDTSTLQRRKAKRSIEEIFAAAYILYTRYSNPYTNRPSDIFDTIYEIIRHRDAKSLL